MHSHAPGAPQRTLLLLLWGIILRRMPPVAAMAAETPPPGPHWWGPSPLVQLAGVRNVDYSYFPTTQNESRVTRVESTRRSQLNVILTSPPFYMFPPNGGWTHASEFLFQFPSSRPQWL
ncbi:hypothetical protein BGW80DRAFT_148039 [Lactifluus volemus]|nr:hypothetical protein BGW80DRAFT_148039 [Lactifluus volemus]